MNVKRSFFKCASKVKTSPNYCDVSLSPEDNRQHQIKRVIFEGVLKNGKIVLVLVPKGPEPTVLELCNDINFNARLDENVRTMEQIGIEELDNGQVRVTLADLPTFLISLSNGRLIAEGDDLKILQLCGVQHHSDYLNRNPPQTLVGAKTY
jgi:hypothetical protein